MKFMPFFYFLSDFKFIFRLIFLLKSRKRGGFFIFYSTDPAEADLAQASWQGARDHRTDATWRKGHVAGPQVAHATLKQRTGRGHVAGGHACPRVHMDSRVGRHVAARGSAGEGPIGLWALIRSLGR